MLFLKTPPTPYSGHRAQITQVEAELEASSPVGQCSQGHKCYEKYYSLETPAEIKILN